MTSKQVFDGAAFEGSHEAVVAVGDVGADEIGSHSLGDQRIQRLEDAGHGETRDRLVAGQHFGVHPAPSSSSTSKPMTRPHRPLAHRRSSRSSLLTQKPTASATTAKEALRRRLKRSSPRPSKQGKGCSKARTRKPAGKGFDTRTR